MGSKKHFLLSFLYLREALLGGNRSMNDTFLSFVLTPFPFVVRVDRDGRGVIGWNGWVWSALGMGVQCQSFGSRFPFFYSSLVKPVHGWGLELCPPQLFPFSLIFSQSFKKGITPNFYFRFLSHSSSPVLYIFYGMTGKESSWGDYPFFSFTFNFFFPHFFNFFLYHP